MPRTAAKPAQADDNNEKEVKPQEPAQADQRYFKSSNDGLKVLVGNRNEDGTHDPDLLDFVSFTRYTEKFQGDTVRVGYLATDNERAIEVLSNDPYVTELSQEDYDKAVESATRA